MVETIGTQSGCVGAVVFFLIQESQHLKLTNRAGMGMRRRCTTTRQLMRLVAMIAHEKAHVGTFFFQVHACASSQATIDGNGINQVQLRKYNSQDILVVSGCTLVTLPAFADISFQQTRLGTARGLEILPHSCIQGSCFAHQIQIYLEMRPHETKCAQNKTHRHMVAKQFVRGCRTSFMPPKASFTTSSRVFCFHRWLCNLSADTCSRHE